MKSDEKKNKHMTLDDRIEIQECLTKRMTFKEIAKRIGKSPTTVSREVKLHQKPHTNGFVRTDEVCPELLKFLFFCDTATPNEKPHIEKNHTLFRDIVPSGASFDEFTQETVDLIFSHVNAVKRKQFNGKSAYDMFTFAYSVELAEALGISRIPPEKVMQSPKLLR